MATSSLINDVSWQKRRPFTQSGNRFGRLSMSSFFTRHNPHPSRVTHIKGLLDVPICHVNDHGYVASPRYDIRFPPYAFEAAKLGLLRNFLPSSVVNVNSQKLPVDTISGHQNFAGLRSLFVREKAVPKIGLVPKVERWKEELMSFINSLYYEGNKINDEVRDSRAKSHYSETTGRLIPPPSRRYSSHHYRQKFGDFPALEHISTDPDIENTVFSLLCQILQTDNIAAVQSWLCNAPEREKNWMLQLIRSAVQWQPVYEGGAEHVASIKPERRHTALPILDSKPKGALSESNADEVDRLTLDKSMKTIKEEDTNNEQIPHLTDRQRVKKSKNDMRNQVHSECRENKFNERGSADIRMRYIRTPSKLCRTENQSPLNRSSEWNPLKSFSA